MPSQPQKPTSLIHEQASRWVTLLHSGICTAAQQRTFEEWLARSETHREAYREIEAFWQELGGLGNIAQRQLAETRVYVHKAQQKPRYFASLGWAVAAILLILACVPLYRVCVDVGVYRTAKGEQTHIRLSDGTRVDLNTNTELQVVYAWLSRKVTLMHGEAFFTVTHNPDKPFEVIAADGLIRDIGTQFNVYRQGDQVSVTVLEGEVSVTNAQTAQPQNLSAGMQLTYRQGGQAQLAQSTDPADASAWRENRMVFKGQTLATVLGQLERYHNVSLATKDPKLQNLKVSGSFPTDNLDLALDTIAASLPVKITRQGANGVVLAKP